MNRSALKASFRFGSRLSLLFLFIVALPVITACVYGKLQVDLVLAWIRGICVFALLAFFFASLSRICGYDTETERDGIAKELDRIALIFAAMTVVGIGVDAAEALANGVTGGFTIVLGTPGISWNLVDIGSTASGMALIRVDIFGLVLAGFTRAVSLSCRQNRGS